MHRSFSSASPPPPFLWFGSFSFAFDNLLLCVCFSQMFEYCFIWFLRDKRQLREVEGDEFIFFFFWFLNVSMKERRDMCVFYVINYNMCHHPISLLLNLKKIMRFHFLEGISCPSLLKSFFLIVFFPLLPLISFLFNFNLGLFFFWFGPKGPFIIYTLFNVCTP